VRKQSNLRALSGRRLTKTLLRFAVHATLEGPGLAIPGQPFSGTIVHWTIIYILFTPGFRPQGALNNLSTPAQGDRPLLLKGSDPFLFCY